jgi:hypothetical protein
MDGVLSLELKLEEEAQIYKEQLDTICVRLEEDSLDERESLSELKKTLEELLSITEVTSMRWRWLDGAVKDRKTLV